MGKPLDLNQFQALYTAIYGHPCVQLDIHQYLSTLGINVDPETLALTLPEPIYYHIELPMNRLSEISNQNLRTFGGETDCKVLKREDIDPYDSSLEEVNIVSVLHRNLDGLYLKLMALPTTLEPISTQKLKIMSDGWIKRLCSKYLGHDIQAVPVTQRDTMVMQSLLAMSYHNTSDEQLVRTLL